MSLLGWIVGCLFVACAVQVACSSSAAAPWQTPHSNVVDEKKFEDLPPTIFAPGGRLYSVERTVKAASSEGDESSNLVVALTCRDGVVVVCTAPRSPHLHTLSQSNKKTKEEEEKEDQTKEKNDNIKEEWTASLWLQDETGSSATTLPCFGGVLLATGGNAVDACILRRHVQRTAESMYESNDGGQVLSLPWISSASLARRVADNLQVATQTIGGRPGEMLASTALIVGLREHRMGSEEDAAFSIWRVDPTGQFWDCDGAAVGRGAVLAESRLLRLISEEDDDFDKDTDEILTNERLQACLSNMSTKEALSIACQCIVETLKVPKDNGDDDTWKQMKGVVLNVKREGKVAHFSINRWRGPDLFNNYIQSNRN